MAPACLSICINGWSCIAEARRKRRYEAAFIVKLSDTETEAAQTQTWLEFAYRCDHLSAEESKSLYQEDNKIISLLISMIDHPEVWLLPLRSGVSQE